jgi:hypothetical protein
MHIYMDVCCLNSPFDDLTQTRIAMESASVLKILSLCGKNGWTLAASEIIDMEISNSGDSEKRTKVWNLYSQAARNRMLMVTNEVWERAESFQRQNIKLIDGLHLALAAVNCVNVFLTTDDRFLAAAMKLNLDIVTANPVAWLMEVTKDG